MLSFITRILLLSLFFCSLNDCAFMDKKNRRITTQLDESMAPESDLGKTLMAPIAIPVGAGSLLTDALVLQPLVAIPMALGDTIDFIWMNPSGGIILQSFLFVPKVIFTPITLGIMWFRHAFIV